MSSLPVSFGLIGIQGEAGPQGLAGPQGPPGAGSIPWFVVTDAAYGADPLGVANSTTNIQAAQTAATAAGGSVMVFPPGVYKIDPLTVAGKTIWQGFGPNSILKFRPPAGQTAVLNIGASDIIIRDLTIDGDESNTAQYVFGASLATAGSRIIFERVTFQNLSGPAILAAVANTDVSFIDCNFINTCTKHPLATVLQTSSPRTLIKGCLFQDWGGSPNYGRAIICYGPDSQILGNRFRGPAGRQTAQAIIVATAGDRTIVANNDIDHTAYAGTGRTNCGIWVDTATHVTIEGNVIRCPTQDDGGLEPIGLLPGADDCIITGNYCSGGDDNGISLWGNRAVCTGNYVQDCAFDGISVNGSDQVVTGNKIRNFGLRTNASNPTVTGPFAGVAVFTGQSGNVISGNHIAQSVSGAAVEHYGVETRGTADYNEIQGNVIRPTNMTGRIKVVGIHDHHQDDPLSVRVATSAANPNFLQTIGVATTNRLSASRFMSGGPITAIKLWIGGTSSGNFIISIYDNDGTGGAPGTRLWTSGSTAFGSTSQEQSVAIGSTFWVDPTRHWIAFIADNSTALVAQYASTEASWPSLKNGVFRDPGSFTSPNPFGSPSAGLVRQVALVGV